MLLSDLFRVGDTVRSRFNRQVRRVRRSPLAVSGTGFSREEGLPNGRHFAFGELLGKAPSNQGLVLLVRPLVPRGSFTPVSLRGPAAIRHPWRRAALAASMPLGPLRETCVRPAPKSRLVSSECYVHEDQKQINSFPAKAGPTVCAHPTGCMRFLSRTGFSREEASSGADIFADSTPPCGSELARECSIQNTRYPVDVPAPS